jgi:hypothetical protein
MLRDWHRRKAQQLSKDAEKQRNELEQLMERLGSGSWCGQNGSNNNRPDAFAAIGGAWAVSSPFLRC